MLWTVPTKIKLCTVQKTETWHYRWIKNSICFWLHSKKNAFFKHRYSKSTYKSLLWETNFTTQTNMTIVGYE